MMVIGVTVPTVRSLQFTVVVLRVACTLEPPGEMININLTPRDCHFIGLGYDLDIWSFKLSPGHSKCAAKAENLWPRAKER